MKADLHCHTKLSDGTLGIDDIIILAKNSGVTTLAITDHDCLAGTTRATIIGERHGEKLYETLLTNEECAHAIDMGDFYRVPADKRDLNYDKYFKEGDGDRNPLTEFNSNNTELLNVEQVKEKLLSLRYIRDELASMEN